MKEVKHTGSTTPVAPSEEQFRLLVETVRDYAILMLDPKGHITSWNAGAERLKGYKADEVIGKHFSCFYTQEATAKNHPAEELKLARLHGSYREEGWRVRKDGSQFWADVLITAINDASGTLCGFAKVTRDLSERKTAEEELLRVNSDLVAARDQAQAASKLKSEFVANMSHEIRTPMNAIIGMCNVLLKTNLDSHQHQYANNIREGANALLTVINDILDFSKIEAGRLELDIVDFDLVRIVESSCELLAPSARSKQLSVMAHIAPSTPEHLRGDPERVRQILINLASNAIKFSTHGEIVIRADLESITNGIANMRFSVTDQGIGINEEQQARLFTPFVQADGSINRRFGGTGLGLSICKSLVDLMNGRIGIQSTSGVGSTFWFEVPLELRSPLPHVTVRDELRDVKVLIVDDESQAREILHSYVLSWGMRNGRSAASAEEALRLLRKASLDGDPFRIAIIDYVLPDNNGMELARDILNDPAISSTQLILLTGFDTSGLGTKAIECGFRAYLTKPVRRSHLLESIITACGSGESIISRTAVDVRLKTNGPKAVRAELVLIVEDYPINQQVAQLYLDELGFASHIASNGNEALEALSQADYSLVLMDCQMPELDGFATTRAIRKHEVLTGRHIPILAMTAHAMGGDRERCLSVGMDDYLTKPVNPSELKTMIEKWLPGDSGPGEPVELAAIYSKYGEAGQRLLKQFLIDGPKDLCKLQNAFRENRHLDFSQVLHGIKGVCGSIFASRMRVTCVDIEYAARAGNWNIVPDLLQRLEKQFVEVQEYLKCKLTKTNQ